MTITYYNANYYAILEEIMLVSKCFLGGTPDGMTVIKSEVLKLLQKGDQLLADKGNIFFCASFYIISGYMCN